MAGAVVGCVGDRWRDRHRAARSRAPCGGQPSSSAACVTQHRRAGIRQHEGQALGRIGGIERQIGAAGLEDAEQPDHHLERALDAQPHHDLGPDAERAQMMRQLVGARIELAVAQALRPRTPPRPHRACGRPARRTAPARSRTGSHARCRSSPAGWCARSSAPESRGCRSHARARQPRPPAAGRAAPPAPRRSRDRTGRWRIPPPRRSPPARRPGRAARPGSPTGRTSRSPSRPARSAPLSPAARARPARCSATPASPGTADAATASAPG